MDCHCCTSHLACVLHQMSSSTGTLMQSAERLQRQQTRATPFAWPPLHPSASRSSPEGWMGCSCYVHQLTRQLLVSTIKQSGASWYFSQQKKAMKGWLWPIQHLSSPHSPRLLVKHGQGIVLHGICAFAFSACACFVFKLARRTICNDRCMHMDLRKMRGHLSLAYGKLDEAALVFPQKNGKDCICFMMEAPEISQIKGKTQHNHL